MRKPKGYWTLKLCKLDALKYKTISEWNEKSTGYATAIRNDWVKLCSKHMIRLGSLYKRQIYCFKFPHKHIYVGLSFDPNKRKKAHLKKKESAVYKFIKKTKTNPRFEILTCFLDKEKAAKKEVYYINYFKRNGWIILNRIKGGGLGSNNLFWTKEKCIAESKKFKSRAEWRKKSAGSYNSAVKNGWLKECSDHMIFLRHENNYWTKERCREDSLKYSTRNEWSKKSHRSYAVSCKNGWVDSFTKHMTRLCNPNNFWTKKKCIADAKKYSSKTEWMKNSFGYIKANKMGWLDVCCKHMLIKIRYGSYWTLIESKKFSNVTDWRKKSNSSYRAAVKNGWVRKMMPYLKKRKLNGFWTKENCLIEAKKFKTRINWQKKSKGSYRAAQKNGWLDECSTHMKYSQHPKNFFTLTMCIEEANKFDKISYWKKYSSPTYHAAKKNGWLLVCSEHMKKRK